VNRRFQAKLAKSKNVHIIKTTASIPSANQILHSDKDHQMPLVDGHDTRITNPRWRMAISENQKFAPLVLEILMLNVYSKFLSMYTD